MTGGEPTPRAWLGDEPFPWPTIDELVEGARFSACYCVESKQLAHTKDEKPYLRLQLCDRSGTVEGRVWEGAEAIDAAVDVGAFVGVRGRMQSFRGQQQLRIDEIAPIAVAPEEYALFLPRYPGDLDALENQLDELVASVTDMALRTLLERLVGRDTETGRAFRTAPAAKRNHHAYVGGLLEHSVSVASTCAHLARHYGPSIDRDLLVTGALIHDIGKIREIGVSGGFPYTDEGKLLGHILLGLRIVEDEAQKVDGLDRERLVLLLHLVASHQGKYEWQSPKIPMLLEALILHHVDDLDAKVHQATALVETVEQGWTRYDPSFGRDFLRHRLEGTGTSKVNGKVEGAVRGEGEVREVRERVSEGGAGETVERRSEPVRLSATGAAPRPDESTEPVRPPEPARPPELRSEDSPESEKSPVPRLSEDTLDLFAG